jgi:SAM-dependent methyltransferase
VFSELSAKANSEVPEWKNVSLPFDLTNGNRLTPELVSYFPRAHGEDRWMLDLGCGSRIFEEFCRKTTGFRYVGIDYDGPNPDILADAHALPFKSKSFDFVLSIAVLEHLAFPDVAMAEVYRVLKPGGIFIGTVAFLETFHMNSYFHMTHLGTLRVLDQSGFEVDVIAPNTQWSGLRAQAEMALFPGLPGAVKRAMIAPADLSSTALWALKRAKHRIRHDDGATRARALETTGGFRFVAHRPAA